MTTVTLLHVLLLAASTGSVTQADSAPSASSKKTVDPATRQEKAEDESVFRSEIAKIELRKPTRWHFADLATVARSREGIKLKDEAFHEQMKKLASAPLVVAMRHPEPHPELNPTLNVLVRPVPGLETKTPREILEVVLPTMEKAYEEFEVVSKPAPMELDHVPAARMEMRYIVRNQENRSWKVRSITVVALRGSILYQIGVSGPAEGPDAIADEPDEILRSIRFLPFEANPPLHPPGSSGG